MKTTTVPAALLALGLLACGDGAVEPPSPPPPPNRAPAVVGSIPAQTIVVGAAASVDASSYFADPDGDALTFTAVSSAATIASVAVTGGRIAVTAVAEGMATVTVTGRDAAGLQATQRFAVTVTVPNRAPVLQDSIPARFMALGETAGLDLSPHFTDPDQDVLTYNAASSDTAVVAVRVFADSLTVMAAAVGTATVTVTARDPDALEASQSFRVRVDPARTVATLAPTHVLLPEGARAVLEVALSTPPSSPISVAYTLGADADPATADADTADFGMTGGTIEIAAGEAGGWLELTVDDDTDIEPVREVFTVVLHKPQRGAAYEVGPDSVATVTILEGVCDRTQEVREVIVALAPTDRCSDVGVSHLAAIDSLVLDYTGLGVITSLKSKDFQGLSNLEVFKLSSHPIAEVPVDVFSGLTRLVDLHLDNNRGLTELPEGIFSGLSSLRFLNLSSNRLTSLPEGVFSGLSSVSVLALTGNRLTTLPEGVFSELVSLEHLGLEYNELTRLPPRVFSGHSGLKSLELTGNELVELPAGVFAGLSSLEWLTLHNNQLTGLTTRAFSGLSSLRGVSLNGNRISELPGDLFSGLSSLRGVSLNGNRISELPAGVFSGLASLERLHLGGNQLIRLPVGLFSGLANLERLNLEDNRLMTLEAGLFSNLSSLGELHLQRNRLEALSEGVFSDLSSLIWLNLFDNRLSRLPSGMFVGLSALSAVSLLGNPGAPFELVLEVRRTDAGNPAPGPATVAVRLAEGAPLPATISLSAVGGTLSANEVSLVVGEEWSSEVTVTRAADARLPARVEVESVPQVRPGPYFNGVMFRAGDPLILFGASGNPGN